MVTYRVVNREPFSVSKQIFKFLIFNSHENETREMNFVKVWFEAFSFKIFRIIIFRYKFFQFLFYEESSKSSKNFRKTPLRLTTLVTY